MIVFIGPKEMNPHYKKKSNQEKLREAISNGPIWHTPEGQPDTDTWILDYGFREDRTASQTFASTAEAVGPTRWVHDFHATT